MRLKMKEIRTIKMIKGADEVAEKYLTHLDDELIKDPDFIKSLSEYYSDEDAIADTSNDDLTAEDLRLLAQFDKF